MSEHKRYTCTAKTTVTQTWETYAKSAEEAAANFKKRECAITSNIFDEWEIDEPRGER
jgi:hypothetical protein